MTARNLVIYSVPLIIVALDQGLKWWTHTHLSFGTAGEVSLIGQWFKLHYVTNPGMAFGMELHWTYAKLVLSLGRVLIMLGVLWLFVVNMSPSIAPQHKGFGYTLGGILGGALGNVIDGLFYGIWYDNAPIGSPMRWGYGQVIDMLYVDIWQGYLPDWVPIFGSGWVFLWPIFNIADAAIFISVLLLLVYPSYFKPQRVYYRLPT